MTRDTLSPSPSLPLRAILPPTTLIRRVLTLLCIILWSASPTLEARANPTVRFVTSHGDFDAELFESESPETVANFLDRVRSGFYRETLFHRLLPGVLLQGGTYDTQWQLKASGDSLPNEGDNGLSNSKWTLAMSLASGGRSSQTEFFINLGDNSDFDHGPANSGHFNCVFGEVTEGHDTLRKMTAVGVISGGDFIGDRPTEDLVLRDIILLTD